MKGILIIVPIRSAVAGTTWSSPFVIRRGSRCTPLDSQIHDPRIRGLHPKIIRPVPLALRADRPVIGRIGHDPRLQRRDEVNFDAINAHASAALELVVQPRRDEVR